MKKVFLTGGSSGIGKAISEYLTSIGFSVHAPERKELDLTKLSSVDLTDYDYLFLCAGVDRNGRVPFRTQSASDIQETIEVNLIANMKLINDYIKCRNGRWSKVVVIGSTIVDHVWPNFVTYGTSKVALDCFIQAVAREESSIGFTQIHPGLVKTNFNKNRGNVPLGQENELYNNTPHLFPEALLPLVDQILNDTEHTLKRLTIIK
jgi:NADP-dependent 3-hydroxy acid dehydrogenase YdfG